MSLLQMLVERLMAASQLLTLLAAYFLGVWFVEHETDETSSLDVGSLTTWLGLGALMGARLVFVLPNWSIYVRYPLDLLYVQTGLSFFGGVAGGLLAATWFAHRHKLAVGSLLDLAAPALALGIAGYRLACGVRGDCGGALAAPPLGMLLAGASQPRYPVEIWEGVLALALFGLLYWWRGRTRKPGSLALAFLVIYPILRAGMDLFRLNLGGWPTADQSLALMTVALAIMVWGWRQRTPSQAANT